ncbi:hypothetical protein GOP47_0014654 [Adiantum capillus-veneris]|uniref:Uncharacterized protein n=1 Tax=Adiantum capillus-veneris TaxID=13818 RepID=A0A9D4UM07_ADICA|nr:hypothetical protein GOP47_0014654 [Adiantum capillus-veneris]
MNHNIFFTRHISYGVSTLKQSRVGSYIANGALLVQVFSKGSWIFIQRVRNHGNLDEHWKGRLLGFKNHRVNGTVAIVQHVYSWRSMRLRNGSSRDFPIHYIFSSNLVEDQPIKSLTGTFNALHADIDVMMLPNSPPLILQQCKIFFYSHTYVVLALKDGYD